MKRLDKSVQIGSIVFSKAGRDAGRFFIVTEILDDTYIHLVDGKLRKLQKPKKKKLKHIKATGDVAVKIREKLLNKSVIYDAEINSIIRGYN